ncbi:uncharacterized protein I303_102476 [Kwoniella dejecticola CBS 10117]|uniref:P-loop containing nucleoside triphosphate hydrolase protein n=1 Tax=Kwoniella dejecticola CBS 10117 TaxID=1296121 RepID=A0AAJ8MFJ4_9TREE
MSSKEDARESLEKTQTNGPDTTPSKLRDLSDSEVQQFPGIIRDHWWQLWRPRHSPPPPKATLEEAEIIPLAYVSMLSKLTFQVRQIEEDFLLIGSGSLRSWSKAISGRFKRQIYGRWILVAKVEAQKWNDRLDSAVPSARLRARWRVKAMSRRGLPQDLASFGPVDSYEHRYRTLESEWRQRSGRKRGSVTWALNDVMEGFWAGGLFKVASDTSQLMIPLLIKALINFSKEGLFLLTVMQSVCQHQFFFRSMATGVLARATLISAIYQKAMMLSVGGRAQHPNGKLLTYLSSDVSDAGNGLRLRSLDIADRLLCSMVSCGKLSLIITSTCTHCSWQIWTAPIQLTITLVLLIVQIGPSALVGFSLFVILAPLQTWFMKLSFKVRKKSMKWTDSRARLKHFRRKEMVGIRKILVIRAANQALAFSVPGLASVLAFVTYAATHDSLDPALIFTSLAFFNLLRQPLMFLPRALSSLTDAQNAVERLTETESAVGETFTIKNLNLSIPRGTIVGIVGSVGSGKSSLLQGLIGEMSILSGSVTFGGRLAYCQQNAWIQNATVRDNILFGQAWDESRYWKAVQASNLVPDLEILADGDLTEIGEKGECQIASFTLITSRDQPLRRPKTTSEHRQSSVLRRRHCREFPPVETEMTDDQLFDDPLSAVDAHVGKALFENAIMPLAAQGKTVLLVTHALHFLPAVDRIYFMSNGQISEQGSFAELSQSGGAASKLFAEFGGREEEKEERQASSGPEPESEAVEKQTQLLSNKSMGKAVGTGKLEGRLMVSEIRKTGSVVYAGYLHAGRSRYTFPLTVFFATIMQGSQVMATVWLTWWQESHFNQTWSVYQGVYAALGISQALFTFAMGATLGVMANLASQNLHSSALENVFYSPKSVFDTQPLGRVLGVFGKDIDTIDNQLPDSLRMMAMTLVTLIGSVAIITVFLHYFIAVIFFVGVGYWLSGLATIRAYGETDRFIKDNAYYMDLENRAYLLSATNQRWLSIRLDFLGACLVFAVAIMSAKGGGGITAAQIALCLTYLTSITQVLGMVTRQSAEVENNMNAVERVLWYADAKSLPQEPAHVIPSTQPEESWPREGAIEFKDVVMSYRPGLPPVLKGLSMSVCAGEKIGIIGRTGAGKTSITIALFRLVDGTLRTNLDPFDLYEDATLYDALTRSCVITSQGDNDHKRLTLDSVIEEEGQNLSVGERSLISLARALVKNSKIVVLDEATAAVDLETDSRIQQTIHREFRGKTLLCIAHRLRTIISWDKILVMNAGEIEVSWGGKIVVDSSQEFDTPLRLFDTDGLFRSMCEKSSITREDIVQARQAELQDEE